MTKFALPLNIALVLNRAMMSSDDLRQIAGEIDAASARMIAIKHHARLFADLALSVSDAEATMHVDSAAVGAVMVYFTAQLEESIESLATAHALTVILGESAVEVQG
jgi:hypothetical protein